MSNSDNRLAPFLRQIGMCMAELDTAITAAAYKVLQTASTQTLDETNSRSFIPPDLEEVLSQHSSPEISLLKEVAHTLPWTPTKTIAKENPKLTHLAAVELIGPTGVVRNEELRMGLLLQPNQINYPNHRHAAEELYLVLSGTALWGQSNRTPVSCMPGSFRHHVSWEWHEMITNDEPLLTFWCLTGDIRFDQYQIMHHHIPGE